MARRKPLDRLEIRIRNRAVDGHQRIGKGNRLERTGHVDAHAQEWIGRLADEHRHLHGLHRHLGNLGRSGRQQCKVINENARAFRTRAGETQPLGIARERNGHARFERPPDNHRAIAIEELHPFALHAFLDAKGKRIARSPAFRLKHQLARQLDFCRRRELDHPLLATKNMQALLARVMIPRRHLRMPRRGSPSAGPGF